MSSPLPHLPAQPLGELPDNPLGAPPRPPLIGKREPLHLPDLIRQRRANGGGGRSTSAPLPGLRRLSGANRPQAQAAAPIPLRRRQGPAPQAPVIVTPRPRPAPPAAPAATPPPQPAQARPRRRTATEARDEARGHLRALYGPQIADHPQLGHADIRDRLNRYNAAHARGFLARAHDAALASAQAEVQQAQRANPGYTPRGDNPPPPAPEPGMPPEVKAKRAAQYAQMRDTLDALRRPAAGGQP